MTTLATTEAEFYDLAMTGDGEPAMLPLEQSPWLAVYQWASWMIPSSHPVVDLGCGTGRFAEQLRRREHEHYHGIDFSAAAIAEAEEYVSYKNSDCAWRRSFEVADLRDWEPATIGRPGNTIYTCLETLEHLEDDIDLVSRVPVGHEFIFSVPNFGGEAHLRVFQNVSDAWHRYGHLLEFSAWIKIGGKHCIHLYRSTRRGDSW